MGCGILRDLFARDSGLGWPDSHQRELPPFPPSRHIRVRSLNSSSGAVFFGIEQIAAILDPYGTLRGCAAALRVRPYRLDRVCPAIYKQLSELAGQLRLCR